MPSPIIGDGSPLLYSISSVGPGEINIWRLKLMSVECEKKITEAFQRNAAFDAEKIKVETVGSKVILVRLVRSLAKKDDAEDAVWAARGVMAIENKLIVEEDLLIF